MNRDTVTGIVGAVLLVAAMVGVFVYESNVGASTLGANAYAVVWEAAGVAGPGDDGSTALGETSEIAMNLSAANLEGVTFTLTWTPGAQARDTLALTVTGPQGQTQSAEGDAGALEVSFAGLNPMPAETTARGNDEADAASRLAAEGATNGTGVWTVVVEFVASSGPIPGAPVGADSNVAWSLATALQQWTPRLTAQ